MAKINGIEEIGKMGFTSDKKTLILSVFGIAGLGAIIGAGSVYYFYVKNHLEERLSSLASQVDDLKKDVEKLKKSGNRVQFEKNSIKGTPTRRFTAQERRSLNYRTSDEDEYFSATSSSSDEDASIISNRKSRITRDKEEPAAGDASVIVDEHQKLIRKIDKLFEGSADDMHEAYLILKSNETKYVDSYDFWWRYAKAAHSESVVASLINDKGSQQSMLENALKYADKSLKLNETCSDAHKWYAISLGSLGQFLKVKEKIENGYVFKEHIDRAIEINPTDSSLHHLLGRFCFEICQLSWVERRVASALFSAPPESTVDEALGHFMQSEQLGKPFIDNRLYIGKCYIAKSDEKNAAHWLSLASQLPVVTNNDKNAQQLVMELLPKYQRYLTS